MFNKEADEWPRRPRLNAASAFRSINIDKAARFSSLAVRRRSELSSSRPGARPAPGSICWDVRESVITLSHRCAVERPPNGGECVPRRRAGPARIVIPTSLGGFHLHLQRQGGLFCRQEFGAVPKAVRVCLNANVKLFPFWFFFSTLGFGALREEKLSSHRRVH